MKKPTFYRLAFCLILVVCILTIESCADHTLPPADEFSCAALNEISYDTDVFPIIETKCAIQGNGGCHNGGNGAALDWRVFSNVQGHATQVKDRITRPVGTSGHMPPIGSLTDAQVRTLVCWVDQGAQDN